MQKLKSRLYLLLNDPEQKPDEIYGDIAVDELHPGSKVRQSLNKQHSMFYNCNFDCLFGFLQLPLWLFICALCFTYSL